MRNEETSQEINDLLGSAVVFATAISDIMAEQLDEVSRGEVTFAQLKLLKLLSLKGRLSVTDVAAFMGISTAAASKGIDRLARAGLLERSEARSDRRALRVSLTPQAFELLQEYDRSAGALLEEIFGGYTKGELAHLTKAIDEMSISVVNHDGSGEDACFRCGIHFRQKCLLRDALHRTCYMDLHDQQDAPRPASTGARVWKRPPP
jgi:DNA-binding MarR family transcriptional regulator